jgi:hypothetical protein
MEILNTNQYNQSISKYKLLSSTAGVGSILTTKLGYYILVSDVNKWEFVLNAQKILDEIRNEVVDNSERYNKAKLRIPSQGIPFIDDIRFVNFLKNEKNLPELICLVGVPSISLNEQFNTPNWNNHPIKKLIPNARAKDFMVRGTHFPKWFYNKKGILNTYNQWKSLWISKSLGRDRFVPPRDAATPIKDSNGKIKSITLKDKIHGVIHYPLYKTLTQTNLILICLNGHLSDIPWPKFLKWKSEKSPKDDRGETLFDLENCCNDPNLKWTESKTKSEGYGSIYIECTKCGLKSNLEGINNLRPYCLGQKPWEIDLAQDTNEYIPFEKCYLTGNNPDQRAQMQVALVTGNNIYYANGFSSLYIPQYLAENKSAELIDATVKFNERYNKFQAAIPSITKESYWEKYFNVIEFAIDNGFKINNYEKFAENLKKEIFNSNSIDESIDSHEVYRIQEYQCFTNNSNVKEKDIKFNDIILPKEISKYFLKIQQIEELKVTQIQLDFNRVKPRERVWDGDVIIESAVGENIYSKKDNEVFVLPANEVFGEGLFFQFDENYINSWGEDNEVYLNDRYKRFFPESIDFSRQGATIKQRIKNNGVKHFLIHTFSHLLMKELEFSCGYPTASLKERLYISSNMSGVLIYTAEGSEGSMGGLVWQGHPSKIFELITKSLDRAQNCSSDPLCWESEGQGVFDLNLAACFSCALVSETSCEEMNLGLDRCVLIHDDYGFFSDFI